MIDKRHKTGLIILGIFILFSVYGIYRIITEKYDINQNGEYTIGKLVEVSHASHGYSYTYEFSVNGKVYKGSNTFSNLLKGCNGFGDCLGRKFKVKYSINNPENSEILLDEELME